MGARWCDIVRGSSLHYNPVSQARARGGDGDHLHPGHEEHQHGHGGPVPVCGHQLCWGGQGGGHPLCQGEVSHPPQLGVLLPSPCQCYYPPFHLSLYQHQISIQVLYTQYIAWYNRVATTEGIEYLVYQASRGSLCSTMQIYAGYIINYVPYTLHSLYTRQPQPGNQNMLGNHKTSPKGADIRWEPVYDGTGPRTSALGYPAKHHSSAIAVKVV